MAREIEEAEETAIQTHIRNTEGQTIDPLNLALVKPTKEYEQRVLSLPVAHPGNTEPIQDPETGDWLFMLGVDPLY